MRFLNRALLFIFDVSLFSFAYHKNDKRYSRKENTILPDYFEKLSLSIKLRSFFTSQVLKGRSRENFLTLIFFFFFFFFLPLKDDELVMSEM